jgi:hypothetical protein
MYERAVELDRDEDPRAEAVASAGCSKAWSLHKRPTRKASIKPGSAWSLRAVQRQRRPGLDSSGASRRSGPQARRRCTHGLAIGNRCPLSAWRSSRRPLWSSIAPSETLPRPTRGHTTPTTLSFRLELGLVRVQLVALISAELSTRSKTTRVEKRFVGRRAMPSPAALRTPSGLRLGTGGHQPMLPSICNSMRRFISTAYSIGSSLTIGSMKPLTISFEASSSGMPWAMR